MSHSRVVILTRQDSAGIIIAFRGRRVRAPTPAPCVLSLSPVPVLNHGCIGIGA